MLVTALKGHSDAVFIDLLTYSDLEILKNRRGGCGGPPLQHTIPPNNKRYLILTYAAEFDRVHYPLPLVYEENPDPERLKEIIRKLREEIETMRSSNGFNTTATEDMVSQRTEWFSLLNVLKVATAAITQHCMTIFNAMILQLKGPFPGTSSQQRWFLQNRTTLIRSILSS